MLLPGYAIGRITNVLSFKSSSWHSKWLLSLILSIAVCPVIYYFIGRIGEGLLWGMLGLCWGYVIYFALIRRAGLPTDFEFFRQSRRLLLAILGVLVLFIVLLVDLEIEERLLRSLFTFDYVKHIAVTDAISRSGVPPINPSFYNGEGLNLFYYYYWFIFPSLVEQIGGDLLTPRHAVLGGIAWSPICLIAITYLFIKQFGRHVLPHLDKKQYLFILLLLGVTGLDLIPVLSRTVILGVVGRTSYVVPSLEWWNEQISSWFSASIWVPHHLGGLIATLFVFIAIEEYRSQHGSAQSFIILGLLCSLSLASALGMSIWVTLVFCVFLVVWFLFVLFRGNRREAWFLFLVGIMALVLVSVYVFELREANHLAKIPVLPTVRSFFPIDPILYGTPPVVVYTTRFLFIPLNYLLELGVFFLGGMLYVNYRKSRATPFSLSEWYVLLLMITSVIVCTFLRANIKYNDLGWRGFMFAQVVLLLYSAPLFMSIFKKKNAGVKFAKTTRMVAAVMLLIGVFGNLYEIAVLRAYSRGPQGEYAYNLRNLYEWVDDNLKNEVIMLHNPNLEVDYFHALYGHRQVILADTTLGKLYGISDDMFNGLFGNVMTVFEDDMTLEEVVQASEDLSFDVLVVKKDDPIWKYHASWMNDIEPAYQNSAGSVYIFLRPQK